MLKKIGGLSRSIYIVLAIIAGFVALPMNMPMVLVVLGLLAGLAMTRERMLLVAVFIIALPIIGVALGHLPAIGAQLAAVTANLQLGASASLGTALAIFLYEVVMEGVTGLTGGAAEGTPATAAR